VSDLVPIKRALLSVSDKSHLADFAKALSQEFGVELISTGGTARFLRDLGLSVIDVSQVTGFPEMMDGRVKTLHPKIHGGLLSLRDNPQHVAAMQQHGIQPIDLVCINLYPFAQTIAKPNVSFEEAIENIDIGGPSMIRSAAKNHRFVLVLTDPQQYEQVLDELRQNKGASTEALRRTQAQRAFAQTAQYDTMIAAYLAKVEAGAQSPMPDRLTLSLTKKQDLRYGENPHQLGALYVEAGASAATEASVAFAKQLHGKELSYINLFDADGAISAVKEFTTPAACIVKHATPCGYATADDLPTAFRKAFEGDSLAAFGGIVALNQPVDLNTAQAITGIKVVLDVIVAPSYAPDALEMLKSRWKNTRILEVPGTWRFPVGGSSDFHMHKIVGGYLLQQRDLLGIDDAAAASWKVVSERQPTAQELADMKFAWVACKHVKSNAIALARDNMMVGAGAGQQDRVNAARIAVAKAAQRAKGAAAGSDAYFPFPDGPQLLLDAGITAIIHPGGSVKDQDTINVVNQARATMIFTNQRHFRH
jgi:phosphoribosylaminoimidazolecarboxamide formyltransferase/IMP cyclohydrolase